MMHTKAEHEARAYMRITIACPHCRSRAKAVNSVEVSPTVREITYQCANWRCGHVYVAGLEVARTLVPSATPSPAVHLPISRLARREQLAFDMASAPEADYTANLYQPMSDWGAVTAACITSSHAPAGRYMRTTTACPHCRKRAVAIDSREMSRTMREITYRCSNWRCGHVYVSALEVLRTVSLSSMPSINVSLPLDPGVRRERLALQLAGTA